MVRRLAAPVAALGAFLLFLVQPMLARRLLPAFGGSAAVWTVTMLTFQVLLLGGYLYAHLRLRVLSPRAAAGVHATLAVAAVGWLFLDLGSVGGGPVPALIGTLLAAVGLPALILATTSPLVQSAAAVERLRGGRAPEPYRLYAVSNAGSFAALLAYPLAVEPNLSLENQWGLFRLAFVLYAAGAAALALGAPPQPPAPRAEGDRPSAGTVAGWVLWSALPSLLFLAVTAHLTSNVAPAPFLWVLPLSIYLISLILCFDRPAWGRRAVWFGLLPLALGLLAVFQLRDHVHGDLTGQIVALNAALFVACMAGHGELARRRPPPAHLTAYALWMAVGGAVGGLVAAVVAPLLLDGLQELTLGSLALAVAALVALLRRPPANPTSRALGTVTLSGLVAALGGFALTQHLAVHAVRFAGRGFYGALRVNDTELEGQPVRVLVHGTIRHGAQFTAPERRRWPTTYYGADAGVGRAIADRQARGPMHLGLVGLGAGTLLNWLRPEDRATVYELDPLVVEVARTHFDALPGAAGPVEVVLGDARVSLAAEGGRGFDVLVLDAFSSDAIPTHLLTAEAFALYRRHLAPDAIVAVHLSNRHLDLSPVMAAEARAAGWHLRVVFDKGEPLRLTVSSTWALLAASEAPLGGPRLAGAAGAESVPTELRWTDDHAPLLPLWEH